MPALNIAILVLVIINFLFLISLTIGVTMIWQDLERKIQNKSTKN